MNVYKCVCVCINNKEKDTIEEVKCVCGGTENGENAILLFKVPPKTYN